MAQVKRDLGLRDELHFHDARGFCVTRLVRAGATLDEIARHMVWSPSWAVKMLDVYASMMGTDSSALLARLGDDGAPKV